VLEAQVPVQAGRVVLLDDEAVCVLRAVRGTVARRLGRALRVALALVLVETVAGGGAPPRAPPTGAPPGASATALRGYGLALNCSGPLNATRQ
jgi:hypothetical protein